MNQPKLNRQQRRQAARAKRSVARQPRWVADPVAVLNLAEQNTPLTAAEIETLDASAWQSIAAFASGKATSAHWRQLVDACNLCEVFDDMGIKDADPTEAATNTQAIQTANTALAAALARHNAGHRLGFDGQGLQAIRSLGLIHNAMLHQCTRGAWIKALNTLRDKVATTPNHLRVAFDSDERIAA